MALTRRQTIAGLAGMVVASGLMRGAKSEKIIRPFSRREARRLAREAWVLGMPPVYIERQWLLSSNVSRPSDRQAPPNQFAHFRDFPTVDTQIAANMNVDTLYSLACIDLRAEPIVLSVPEMGNRYWIMQLVDAWNNVPAAPGSRTVGGQGGNFVLVGPRWHGSIPAGLTHLHLPTTMLLLKGRTYVANEADLPAVHALQDKYQLVPLSSWGSPYSPPTDVPIDESVDMKKTVQEQTLRMTPDTFFNNLNRLLVYNPPEPPDPGTMDRLTRVGVIPGRNFDFASFDQSLQQDIYSGVLDGQREMQSVDQGKAVNTWRFALDMGRFGKNYALRAYSTFFNLGCNLAEDAIYPTTAVDSNNLPLDAAYRYVLHFRQDEIPPVKAFWSLTMYDSSGFLSRNPIDRYALGDRSQMTYGKDGSLTIFIQQESPGPDKEANWLPTPDAGGMMLILRLYQPRQEAIDGTWKPPAIQRVEYN
jgi:hypothetical protein